jgi:putative restriction endonuclease
MLLAGHIKPWRDSTPIERLDPRNGLAACPAHDVAFDTGSPGITWTSAGE